MQSLEGRLTISRPRGGSDDHPVVCIRVEDQVAGVVAVEVKVPLSDFAEALMSLANVSCQFKFNDSGAVGTKREHKYIEVFVPQQYDQKRREALIKKAFAPFEVEGWKGQVKDAHNSHNAIRYTREGQDSEGNGGYYRVLFERQVPRNP